ncbi:MAG TPA: ferritin-like domain-containing protein [Solirubrobacteraceae bacterium]|jgi:rubrerythrin|nr:ferritin-like domain-containing protein [Solirubrobacteraceae bacterium]
MTHINLEAVDTDGAIREAAEAVAGDTRMSFLRKGAMAGGAALSGGAILGALIPGSALAAGAPPSSFGKGDIGILNYALTLEYLESSFYNEAAASGKITNKALKQFLTTVQKDENAHVKLLKGALGSKAAKKPKFDFQGIPSDPAKFAATAYVLENTGVHAYLGQAANIKDSKILLTAASIVTVEARHSGAIGLFLGKSIAPAPLDTGLTAAKVLAAVKKTGFIKA